MCFHFLNGHCLNVRDKHIYAGKPKLIFLRIIVEINFPQIGDAIG